MAEILTVSAGKRATWQASVSMSRAFAAEAVKLTTLPSFVLSFVMVYLVLGGFGVLTAVARIVQRDAAAPTVGAEPGAALAGVQGAQLIVVCVAAVFATSEFAQRTVQPSFLAVPTRTPVLLGKALLLGLISFMVGAAGAATALGGAALLSNTAGLEFEIAHGYALQLIAGTGLYLVAISLIGLAIGTLVRSTVGALLTGLALLNVAPLLLGAAPVAWLRDVAAYLPSTAGLMILQEHVPAQSLPSWVGLAIAAGWAAAVFVIALLVIRRTDA